MKYKKTNRYDILNFATICIMTYGYQRIKHMEIPSISYMQTLESWFPKDLEIHFQRGEYPVWIWKANRFEMLQANTKCFALQQNLPEPYNRMAQPPVIVVYDGVGPYFYYEKTLLKTE